MACRRQVASRSGDKPACPVTWRPPMRRVRMNDMRSGSSCPGSVASYSFPSTAGTLRDPINFAKEWRTARDELGLGDATAHSFRKTVATLIDDEECLPASAPITSGTATSARRKTAT